MDDADDAADRSELERLLALWETGLLRTSPPAEFEDVCRQARQRFGVDSALVTLIGTEQQVVAAQAGSNFGNTARSDAFCNHTIRADDVLVVPDATRDPRFAGNRYVVGSPFLRFYAGAPLIYLRGIRFGALCLLDTRPRDFTLGDRAELAELADLVTAAIARAEFVLPEARPAL